MVYPREIDQQSKFTLSFALAEKWANFFWVGQGFAFPMYVITAKSTKISSPKGFGAGGKLNRRATMFNF